MLLAKILISETIIKTVPAVVCINGLTVTFQVEVVSLGIFRPNAKKVFVAFPWVETSTGPGGFMICVFII